MLIWENTKVLVLVDIRVDLAVALKHLLFTGWPRTPWESLLYGTRIDPLAYVCTEM